MPRDELSKNLNRQDAVDAARAAEEREDWAEAARLWTAYCNGFADDANGFIRTVEALLKSSQTEEAEQVLATGLGLHPGNGPLSAAHARVAERRGDWVEALARWEAFLDRFPKDPAGYSGVGNALNQSAQAQLRRADQVLRAGLELQPQNGDLLGTYARLAAARRDWLEALARWEAYRGRLSDDPISYIGVGAALRALGRMDEAEATLGEAAGRFPGHAGVLGEFARAASERHDWPEALRRWTAFRERCPDDPEGHQRVRLTLNELGRFDEADRGFEQALSKLSPDKGLADLFLRFESLGDNCEFGVVQRYYGADPLGLLRFTYTPPKLLGDALRARFAGVGEPDNTILFANRGEWITQDTRYHMAMHTMLRESVGERDRTFVLICRRLQYLRDKLIDDLTEARKHMVYACRDPLADEEVRPLWEALRAYGENRLLFVRLADDAHPPGMLRHIEGGLIIGYVDQLSVDAPSFELWLQMCREAESIWSSGMAVGELIEPDDYAAVDAIESQQS